jgi:putative peptide zinc metalloprotease protein
MQTLLSEHWHAVRFLKPRLREGVEVLHRRLRGKPWVLLVDPLAHRFHRLTPRVWRVLQLLDGRRTVDEVWSTACAQSEEGTGEPEAVISQQELVQLLSTLYANDLLQTQVSPDAGEVFERYRRQRRARWKQNWLNPMSVKLPLLYPDAWFERHAGWARCLFSLPVALVWLAAVAPAAALAWQHWNALTENLTDRVLSASNVSVLWLIYPLVKAVHEWAHGMAVKAWGGTVREIGVMFLIFTPIPYVDATSSYRFPSKWARAAVAAAGIAAELFLGALAVYAWLLAEPGWVTTVAFNVILIAGVSTLLVNGNPLMRYDGYHVLCDLLELPNLAQRAAQYWTYLIDRYAYGARRARPPTAVDGERPILAVYGAVAPVYRLLVTIGLAWFVASEYLFVGAVMALAGLWSAFVLPVWKGWKHLSENAVLAGRRGPALRRTALALIGLAGFLGLVPVPFYSVQQAVVWLPDEAIVRAESGGTILRAEAKPGETIGRGASLAILDNPVLRAEFESAEATVAETKARLRKALVDQPARIEPLRTELAARERRFAELKRRLAALTVVAGTAGRWVPAAPTELPGRYVQRGEVVGYVVPGPSRLVRTAVTQEDMDLIRSRLRGVEVRLANAPRVAVAARLNRQVPGGEFDLVSPALGTGGGGEIAVDPSQPEGTKALRRVFDVEIAMLDPSRTAVFGDRAYVRFELDSAPLGWQWFLRLRQMFLARLAV